MVYTYIGAIPRYGSYYGQGSGPLLIYSDLQCTGSEFRLLDCPRGPYSIKNCGRYNEAGVKCQGRIIKGKLLQYQK